MYNDRHVIMKARHGKVKAWVFSDGAATVLLAIVWLAVMFNI